jgi:hypothetical protein
MVESTQSDFVFLNLVNLAPLAPLLRHRLAKRHRIVLLSHGLESVDFLFTVQSQAESGVAPPKRAERKLGHQLFAERKHRRYIDHVFCLSPFEAEIERWLGARGVTWLPRTVPERLPLPWAPKPYRLGFVGTMDHPPNREGLLLFLKELERISPKGVELRVVGGPDRIGHDLSRRFQFVTYLGQLPDDKLEQEASSWACFVHPLFCYARGCSTKLAVALGWQIPIATTASGRRGYQWSKGSLPLVDTPEELVQTALRLSEPIAAVAAQKEVAAIARSAPKISEVAGMLRAALALNQVPVWK